MHRPHPIDDPCEECRTYEIRQNVLKEVKRRIDDRFYIQEDLTMDKFIDLIDDMLK